MNDKKLVQDVAYGDTHKRLLSGLPKSEMIIEYGKWAASYDWQCKRDLATHKEISARALIESLGNPTKTVNVFDAACGTGLVAEWLVKLAAEKSIKLDITGVDFSPEMLIEADKKNIYSKLLEQDLSEDLDLDQGHFDAFLAVGLFLDGHCGPEIIPKLMRYIKVGGVGVITVRRKTYVCKEDEYLKFFKLSNLSIVRNFVGDYLAGGVEGNYIILRKEK